jgi:hypothetical protein
MKLGYLALLPALVGTACAYLATTTASILLCESSGDFTDNGKSAIMTDKRALVAAARAPA